MQFSLLTKPLSSAAVAAWTEYQFQRNLHCRPSKRDARELHAPVGGDYLISTDKGIFRLAGRHIRKICGVPAFGIAVEGGALYLASWQNRDTFILRGNLEGIVTERRYRPDFRELYRVSTAHDGMRFHQICLSKHGLWIANTARNSLTKIDRRTGKWLAELAPFTAGFGDCIVVDHNHVNSVFALDNILLFTAFRIGLQSLVGICGRNMIRGFAYKNAGVHDILLRGLDIFVSDSYRFNERGKGGIALCNWQPFDPPYFSQNPQGFVRGIAGCGEELIIGNSFEGSREERFSGAGNLLVADRERVKYQIEMPAAQVYDVILSNGASFDVPPAEYDFDQLCAVLETHLGRPVLEIALDDASVSEKGKKFDDRDQGQIDELR